MGQPWDKCGQTQLGAIIIPNKIMTTTAEILGLSLPRAITRRWRESPFFFHLVIFSSAAKPPEAGRGGCRPVQPFIRQAEVDAFQRRNWPFTKKPHHPKHDYPLFA
jgi:hypothetical protein